MLIVRPNQKKLNPTYLKMFMDSEMGQSALKSIQKGNVIVTITASGLSTVEIPLISPEKQKEKAERYNTKLSTLAAYKQEIERIENSLKNLFILKDMLFNEFIWRRGELERWLILIHKVKYQI